MDDLQYTNLTKSTTPEAIVLNLVINGWPSIQNDRAIIDRTKEAIGFKPCYKWMTFNTESFEFNGDSDDGFKPCYKWMTFNTLRNYLLFKGEIK